LFNADNFNVGPSQWAKSPKKQSVRVYVFDNMALHFECRINNALLQTVFLTILPTGLLHKK